MNINHQDLGGRRQDIHYSPISQLNNSRSFDERKCQTEFYDKNAGLEQKIGILSETNEGLLNKNILKQQQSKQLSQYKDQNRAIENLQTEVYSLKKTLKSNQKTQDTSEDRESAVERELEIRKKQFQQELLAQTRRIGLIGETCDELQKESRQQNDRIQQKNEEIKQLLEENETLRKLKKETNEIILQNDILVNENKDLKERLKSLQEDMNIFQIEKRDTQQKMKEEINKLKIGNRDYLETINKQIVEIQDCINMTNKYKDTIFEQQKNLEISNQTNIETNQILIAIDELVRSTSILKNDFISYQGDGQNSYDILYILKSNIITLTKSFQDLKHSKNKYKNKCVHSIDEVKDLREQQKIMKIEIEQLNTEKLVITQQFEQTIAVMEQQINVRNIEELKLKNQLSELSNQIEILDKEIEDKEYNKFKTLTYQFGSYVNAMHNKLGQLQNIKQICSSFITGYFKLLNKISQLSKQLAFSSLNSPPSVKERVTKKLKKVIYVVYFTCAIKSRRNLLKTDLNFVRHILKQSSKFLNFVEKQDMTKEFGQIILAFNIQQSEFYPKTINQQESTHILQSIERNILQKFTSKDEEITLLKQKFVKISEDLQNYFIEREAECKLILDLKIKLQEQQSNINRLEEENLTLIQKLKFHRSNLAEDPKFLSSRTQSQDNLGSIQYNPYPVNSPGFNSINSQFSNSQFSNQQFSSINNNQQSNNLQINNEQFNPQFNNPQQNNPYFYNPQNINPQFKNELRNNGQNNIQPNFQNKIQQYEQNPYWFYNKGLNSMYMNNRSKNLGLDDIQFKQSPIFDGRKKSDDIFTKFKSNDSNFQSQVASPLIQSNLGSSDILLKLPSQNQGNFINDNDKNFRNSNVQKDIELNQLLIKDKQQAYLELKLQQKILQEKLDANSNEIERLRSASQSKNITPSNRNSVDKKSEQKMSNFASNLSNNNITNTQEDSQNQLQMMSQNLKQNTNQSNSFIQGLPKTNNYTFNNSSAQLTLSDSNRKTKTIQDQLKYELLESQKFNNFFTQQQ